MVNNPRAYHQAVRAPRIGDDMIDNQVIAVVDLAETSPGHSAIMRFIYPAVCRAEIKMFRVPWVCSKAACVSSIRTQRKPVHRVHRVDQYRTAQYQCCKNTQVQGFQTLKKMAPIP